MRILGATYGVLDTYSFRRRSTCAACGERLSRAERTVNHIVAKALRARPRPT